MQFLMADEALCAALWFWIRPTSSPKRGGTTSCKHGMTNSSPQIPYEKGQFPEALWGARFGLSAPGYKDEKGHNISPEVGCYCPLEASYPRLLQICGWSVQCWQDNCWFYNAIFAVVDPLVVKVDDVPEIIAGFQQMYFSNCSGAIDGVYVPII